MKRHEYQGELEARAIRNANWSVEGVRGQYSYRNAHSDLYRHLSQWADFGYYLNIGYTRRGAKHRSPQTHERLVDRLATGLLAMRASSGLHSQEFRLLDIASGRGGPAIYVCEKYGLDVVGVDITPYNISKANRNSRKKKLSSHVQFFGGNALELPIRAGCFSLAWCIESPAHFSDKPAFLREAHRVLRPGGYFAFADLLAVNGVVTASRANRRIYEHFLSVWDVPYLETFPSYLHAIQDAGFKLKRFEIATKYNLRIFEQYCRPFLAFLSNSLVYSAYASYIKGRTGAELKSVYDHVIRSYRALRLGMIDYGLFWAVRQ